MVRRRIRLSEFLKIDKVLPETSTQNKENDDVSVYVQESLDQDDDQICEFIKC